MPHQDLYNKIFTGNKGISNSRELLQNVANEYPYFSLAHFFLLKETASTDFNYRKLAAKTALHFNNPFLLKYQLNRKFREASEYSSIQEVHKVDMADKVDEVSEVEMNKEVNNVDAVNKADVVESVQDVVSELKMNKEVENVEEVNKADVVESVQEEVPEVAKIAEVMEIQDVEKVEKAEQKEELLFEPLHMTDYFASQGIKLSEEVQTGDKLGKQLKSFTDWLKTMKKVGQGKFPATSPAIELAVQNLAEKSNKEQEVLTESMAEVYLQQGKAEKANEIYKKLSLLNPSKSAYFAAKIELLKEN
ncbi:MAG: hypothetical protein ABI402_01385 [Ferruginibacter sp.]